MRIRSKLLLLLTVPLLAITLAAGVGFRSQSAASERAEAAEESVDRTASVHTALGAITVERLVVLGADIAPRNEAQDATDAALQGLTDLAAASRNEELANAAIDASSLLNDARRQIDLAETIDAYSEAHDVIAAVEHDIASTLPSNDALNQYIVTRLVVNGVEAQHQAWFHYLTSENGTENIADVARDFAVSSEAFATATDLAADDDSFTPDGVTELRTLEIVALDDLADGGASLGQSEVVPALADFAQRWTGTIAARDAELQALIDDDLRSADNLRSLFSLLAGIGAFVLGGLVFVIYRSITHPLNDLLVRADAVAHDELPRLVTALRHSDGSGDMPVATPIPVTSNDEIGELIEAFNDVQSTAYSLATEQAIGRRNVGEMFVNLGRRNQQLLQRMLAKLTDLEHNEEDPDTLDDLFQLDNIVTRMRRNAESLLVLAGAQTPRQWTAPVPVEDAVRAAFGEVEGYERIDIAALADADIRGNVVADVAHLLAELLENSINFSAASTKVLVNGQYERDGYQITVFDQGIGMDPVELDEANRRISDPPPLDQVPTKFLGLFVVGRLADRHGIEARLMEAPGRGIMARIQLPASVLVRDEDEEFPSTESSTPAALPAMGDSSPLETTSDLDEEWQELAERQLESASIDTGVADELPVRNPDAQATQDATGELPVRNPDAQAIQDATGELPVRDVAPVEAMPELVAEAPVVDELPVRNPDAQATQDATGELPVRNRTTPEPAPEPAEAAPSMGELPTRRRGETLGEPQLNESAPQRRKDDGDQGSAADASQFSSVMSALSTGISRGLEESRIEAELDSDDRRMQ